MQAPNAVSPGSVTVVLAANDSFVIPLSVCLKSALMYTSRNRKYDFFVLSSDIDRENQKLLRSLLTPYPNATLRFVNAMPYLEGHTLKAHAHITVETFFRFLIQDILPDRSKAIYLDADTLVCRDLGALYDTPLDGCMLAAVKDPDFIGQVCGAIPGMDEYARDVLQLSDPYSYFQAGVLLLNLAQMRKAYSSQQWLALAAQDFRYSDQDVLNKYCQGKVKFLDMGWNVLYDCDDYRVEQVISRAPQSLKDAYMASREDPYIIHYAGFVKPWQRLPVDFGREFWSCARLTPYYAQLITKLTTGRELSAAQKLWANIQYRTRNTVDRIFPLGSAARERLKGILRSLGILN